MYFPRRLVSVAPTLFVFCLSFLNLLLPVASASTVKGHIDVKDTNHENFSLRGWACQTGRNESIRVHVYLGGPAGSGTNYKSLLASNSSEQGVANACKNSLRKNRFSYKMSLKDIYKYRGKSIYVHGISTIGSGNKLLTRSGTYKIPSVPSSSIRGHIDTLTKSGADYYVRGWACQKHYKTPIDVHVYAGGRAGGGGSHVASGKASRSTGSSIARECGTDGRAYGFNVKIPASKVKQFSGKAIYVHGISLIGTGNSTITQSGKFSLPSSDSRHVIFVHTDLLGSPVAESYSNGN